jgi:hypothetical protein
MLRDGEQGLVEEREPVLGGVRQLPALRRGEALEEREFGKDRKGQAFRAICLFGVWG